MSLFITPLVTFIMPTLGRPTLSRALESLISQKDTKWNAIIVFDNVRDDLPIKDKRIKTMRTDSRIGEHGQAGFVRNKALPEVKSLWTAFLDDDDTLTNDYVNKLSLENQNLDLVIFRMRHLNGRISPPYGKNNRFAYGKVGISFSVKNDFIKSKKILFGQSNSEDFNFLMDCKKKGAKFTISQYVTYKVRH